MKKCMVKGFLLLGIIASLFIVNHANIQELQVYKHPRLNIQFEAPANWEENPYHRDKSIYEIFDPDTDIHIMLWYTTTEQDGPSYLEKMADMKDLVPEGKPEKIQIRGRDAWFYNVPGFINKKCIRMLLAVIPDGKSKTYPRENALHIIQIWCPREQFAELEPKMMLILNSVQITENMIPLASTVNKAL
ncbi:MAG: hypothetical protein AMS23_01610 [Bacteroides sp. SM1_62]|nr:MAG: hypothetical protein AMS23_01610 [Bacteroides sp. SM1_62]